MGLLGRVNNVKEINVKRVIEDCNSRTMLTFTGADGTTVEVTMGDIYEHFTSLKYRLDPNMDEVIWRMG